MQSPQRRDAKRKVACLHGESGDFFVMSPVLDAKELCNRVFDLVAKGKYTEAASMLCYLDLLDQKVHYEKLLKDSVRKEDFFLAGQLKDQIARKLPYHVDESSVDIKVKDVPLFCKSNVTHCNLHRVRLLSVAKLVQAAGGSQLPIHVGDDEGYVACIVVRGLSIVPDEWCNTPLVSIYKLKRHAHNCSLLDMEEVKGNISIWHEQGHDWWATKYPYCSRVSRDFSSFRRSMMCTLYGWVGMGLVGLHLSFPQAYS